MGGGIYYLMGGLNSVWELDKSNCPEDELTKKRPTKTKTKYPQKNARENKRVEAVATACKQLQTTAEALQRDPKINVVGFLQVNIN